ncbi:MAG TPA: endonuclease [Pyrinomonadaceae bacterium]|jgi:endonuclease I
MESNFDNEAALFDLPEFQAAIAEFQAAAARPYYDEAADEAARDEYYRDIQPDNLNEQKFYAALNRLLTKTHTDKKSYKPAVHLYPWVDLRESGSQLRLKSIYSEKEFDAEDLIAEDFRIERQRERLRQILTSEAAFTAIEPERQLDLLEAAMPFNCEHVVPQSWFRKKEPMRGDLHHLFACEIPCNSMRGNFPFFDFPDFGNAIKQDCGKSQGNEFEPAGGKGAVARATLYFLLRYPGEINRTSKEYTEAGIETLLKWHRGGDVSRYEKHRNAAIQEKQGNRNPLIDFPEWAERIDFSQGLG